MKKLALILVSAFMIFLTANSQNIDDALRYSQTFYGGTARFMSMGGAFTALGADLSAISLNPAGVGVYRSYEISLTPQLLYNNTKSTFNGTKTSDFRYNFGLNQIGIVTSLISNNNSTGLLNLNVSYSYVRTNSFNENTTISGVSNNSSMADYWARISEGTNYKKLTGAPGIAYDAWIMDTITGSGATSYGTIFSSYGENANSTYGQTIRRVINNEGYTGEHAFSIGGNISNKIFFGATLGVSKLKYTGHYEHLEMDESNSIPDFKNFDYINHFEAIGTGYSLKIGTIIKPIEMLRIGLAFHSPIVYRINESYYDNISSAFDNGDSYQFDNQTQRYSYTLTTPFRFVGGVALQLKKLAIISADYEFVDYRMARFSKASDDYNYYSENQSIKDVLKSTSNLKLGAEFRVNSKLYLRAGYGLYGKMFKPGEINADMTYNSLSFGIGFRQDNFFFDMAFTSLSNTQKYFMYDDPPYLTAASIQTAKNTFYTTFGFKF
jgi:hypothetical protein